MLPRRCRIDSTSVRAHQHAAGARFHEFSTHLGLGRITGSAAPASRLTIRWAAPWRLDDESMLTDQFCGPLTMLLTAGQAGDNVHQPG